MKSARLCIGFFLSSILFSSAALAESFKYNCVFLTDRDFKVKIEVSETQMSMFDQPDGLSRPGRGRGKLVFNNLGIHGGNGKMKDRLKFKVDWKKSEVAPMEIYEYFLTPQMATGGMLMRNGSKGGFMTFAGHGYSWETYVCFRE
jgi:hypothetical protein